jgi:hypothetical protein
MPSHKGLATNAIEKSEPCGDNHLSVFRRVVRFCDQDSAAAANSRCSSEYQVGAYSSSK